MHESLRERLLRLGGEEWEGHGDWLRVEENELFEMVQAKHDQRKADLAFVKYCRGIHFPNLQGSASATAPSDGDSFSISKAGPAHWTRLQSACGLTLEHLPGDKALTGQEDSFGDEFCWQTQKNEDQHSVDYVAHIQKLLSDAIQGEGEALSVVPVQNVQGLLTVDHALPFRLKGTTDVCVTNEGLSKMGLTREGLIVAFKLKKTLTPTSLDGPVRQMHCQLVAANLLCPHLRPVAVLTTLSKTEWIISFIDGSILCTTGQIPRSAAISLLCGVLRPPGASDQSQGILGRILSRQRLPNIAGGTGAHALCESAYALPSLFDLRGMMGSPSAEQELVDDIWAEISRQVHSSAG